MLRGMPHGAAASAGARGSAVVSRHRPRYLRLSRLVLTYVVPIVPLATIWDGVASCMRVYSPDEMRALIASLPPSDYEWDIGRLKIPRTGVAVTYLTGVSRAS